MMDTLKYVKRLEAAGVSRKQAETQVEIMADIVVSNFATKSDIAKLERDIAELRTEMKSDMQNLSNQMTIRLGGMLVVGLGAIAALLKLG